MPALSSRLYTALTALPLVAGTAQAEPLNVLTWGGEFTAAQQVAFSAPFTEAKGHPVRLIDVDSPTALIKAQVLSGNVTADVVSIGQADAERLCEEGLAEPIDPALIAPAPDGTPAAQDFLPGGISECFVATDVYSAVIGFDAARIGPEAPATIMDFFDLQKFPGRRGVLKEPRFTLEMALIGDGVPPGQVYDLLDTPEGLDRAFAKLDSIRDQIVWWEAGAQPVQLLADAEVAMTMSYNGRLFAAKARDGMPFEVLWHGQVYEIEGWMIPQGAPQLQTALEFVAFTTAPEPLARAAEQLSYGPPRASSQALVGNWQDSGIPMAPHLPTAPQNLAHALAIDVDFWADNDVALTERFNTWLAAG